MKIHPCKKLKVKRLRVMTSFLLLKRAYAFVFPGVSKVWGHPTPKTATDLAMKPAMGRNKLFRCILVLNKSKGYVKFSSTVQNQKDLNLARKRWCSKKNSKRGHSITTWTRKRWEGVSRKSHDQAVTWLSLNFSNQITNLILQILCMLPYGPSMTGYSETCSQPAVKPPQRVSGSF